MANKMLIDATHPEETRVVVLRGNRVEEFDFESAHRKQLRGNIYLAKVTRVEPSLQAAFVDYGGNRHGFLAFSEIHPDYYQIPVADRQALIDEEERAQRAADDEVDRRSRRGRGRDRHAASHREDDTLRSELAETPGGDAAPVDQAAEAAESHDVAEAGTSAADLLPPVSPESAPDSDRGGAARASHAPRRPLPIRPPPIQARPRQRMVRTPRPTPTNKATASMPTPKATMDGENGDAKTAATRKPKSSNRSAAPTPWKKCPTAPRATAASTRSKR